MLKHLIALGLFLALSYCTFAQPELKIQKINNTFSVSVVDEQSHQIAAPAEGLWSVATAWENGWPADWHHVKPVKKQQSGEWTILSGKLELPQGKWHLRDAYRMENGMVKCIRRFEWKGEDTLRDVTLSVRWNVEGDRLEAFLPGILYYGNPSGKKNRPQWVPHYDGKPGEMAIFEEHRYPMPFACLESGRSDKKFGAAIHTIPSPIKDRNLIDHWWSMGVKAHQGYSELTLLSGPIAYNNQKSVAKALQSKSIKYSNTSFDVEPGTVIEKTFYIDVYGIDRKGTAFQPSIYRSLEIFKPYYTADLPEYEFILRSKHRFARSRWIEGEDYSGFNMYPPHYDANIVMGWCGQAASCGYAFQNLQKYFDEDHKLHSMIQQSLDFLSNAPVNENGFPVRFNIKSQKWARPDHVSMGQGMYNFAKAIQAAKGNDQYDTRKWEAFLKKTCDYASERILDPEWNPRSTAEAFYIAPLVIASELYSSDKYREAATKGAEHYADRHLAMEEPYWGGTLDAQCEDKEGAWAAFQGFLSVYEMTGKEKYLKWARHAFDVLLSYTVVWDIPSPPGRLADHFFKTRGWTVVSPQNQHLDIYGVMYTPEVYKMGEILNRDNLKQLAKVMYRSCGQLIDPYGSQGEQIQHTNFAQQGEMDDIYKLRGGYSEGWTVFWITAHFLNAAARFEEMNVELDQEF